MSGGTHHARLYRPERAVGVAARHMPWFATQFPVIGVRHHARVEKVHMSITCNTCMMTYTCDWELSRKPRNHCRGKQVVRVTSRRGATCALIQPTRLHTLVLSSTYSFEWWSQHTRYLHCLVPRSEASACTPLWKERATPPGGVQSLAPSHHRGVHNRCSRQSLISANDNDSTPTQHVGEPTPLALCWKTLPVSTFEINRLRLAPYVLQCFRDDPPGPSQAHSMSPACR